MKLENALVPPHDNELENAVLGSILLERGAFISVAGIIKTDSFYSKKNQVIFNAASNLFSKGEPIDIITICNELKSTGDLDLVGGPFYVSQLTNRIGSTTNVETHARIIEQFAIR